jgi:hypothetical protein
MPESADRQKCKKIFMKPLRKTRNAADTVVRPTYQLQQW